MHVVTVVVVVVQPIPRHCGALMHALPWLEALERILLVFAFSLLLWECILDILCVYFSQWNV